MTAARALGRRENWQPRPAQMADDPFFLAGQKCPARHTRSRQQKIERSAEAILNCEAG